MDSLKLKLLAINFCFEISKSSHKCFQNFTSSKVYCNLKLYSFLDWAYGSIGRKRKASKIYYKNVSQWSLKLYLTLFKRVCKDMPVILELMVKKVTNLSYGSINLFCGTFKNIKFSIFYLKTFKMMILVFLKLWLVQTEYFMQLFLKRLLSWSSHAN